MFYYIRWSIWAVFWLFIATILHYTLPQTDIVRIVQTEIERFDMAEEYTLFWSSGRVSSGSGADIRDINLIRSVNQSGDPMVYRNEDTGWGWPPYFKFDTANLQTEAQDLLSTSDEPKWVAVRHYGWRSPYFSIFPNAISVWQVPSPDTRIIPWFNIVFLILFGMVVWAISSRVRRWRNNRLNPAIAEVGDALDRVGDRAEVARGRLGQWFSGS